MRRKRYQIRHGRFFSGLLALALLATVDRAAAQDSEGRRALIAEAVREYQSGRYPEAQALFRRAHALNPSARTLRGLGMASFEMREYVSALRALRAALAEERHPLTETQREHAQSLIERATVFVARYQLEIEPEAATLWIDGEPPELEEDGSVLLDAGQHTISVMHPGHHTRSLQVRVQGGSDRSLRLALEAIPGAGQTTDQPPVELEEHPPEDVAEEETTTAEEASASSTAPTEEGLEASNNDFMSAAIVTLVSAGVIGVASVVTGLMALNAEAELVRNCPYMVCDGADLEATQSTAQNLAIATDVLWPLATAVGVAGAILTTLGLLYPVEEDAQIQFACTPGGCSLAVEGAF